MVKWGGVEIRIRGRKYGQLGRSEMGSAEEVFTRWMGKFKKDDYKELELGSQKMGFEGKLSTESHSCFPSSIVLKLRCRSGFAMGL